MVKYYYEGETFIIEDYDQAKTFSSFLPGIAGLHGVPIWSFYVNRGQGLCSFGIQDKNSAILEFFPGNTSYQYVNTYGFRTFIKCDDEVYEPFAPTQKDDEVKRVMFTKQSEFGIVETNLTKGIKVTVTYFGMPNENFGALVRKVSIENISDERKTIEVLDGLATLLPYGVENGAYKEISNLLRSWMEVENLESNIPFFKVRASIGDEAEVSEIERGHFAFSFSKDQELLKPIIDADLVFGYDTTLSYPQFFMNHELEDILNMEQVSANKVPCQFATLKTSLLPQEVAPINTIIGHIEDVEMIKIRANEIATQAYINMRQQEAKNIIDELVETVETKSANTVFDAYAKQNYLDNLLRGGYPLVFGTEEDPKIYHVYSRKHGDLERDYNFFSLAPEFYSQGNGNFRDVNQNRRNDVFFNPKTGLYNVKTFMNLIQLDGYNPLSVLGSTFSLNDDVNIVTLVEKHFATHQKMMSDLLSKKFTPGKIINTIERDQVTLQTTENELLNDILAQSKQHIEAQFGEGYWVDHWTYNMDLIENYLLIHPEKLEAFLVQDQSYQFFDSPVYVMPRREKYVLTKKGEVRQYGSIMEDEEKMHKHQVGLKDANWLKTNFGQGKIYQTNLLEKVLSLGINKFMHLDPAGMGIEMEGNKPGWNDAMNGLPGIFGSGVSESVELVRLLEFLATNLKKLNVETTSVLCETANLLVALESILTLNLNSTLSDFDYWNKVYELKETYREKIRFGVSGATQNLEVAFIIDTISAMIIKLEAGLEAAKALGNGLLPTFLTFEATEYEVMKDEFGNDVFTHYGLPAVKVLSFKVKALPYFLEAPARALKVYKNQQEKIDLYEKIKSTEIFDNKIKMYKTSVSLEDMTHEIGRARAFTAGWLERESVFLHMTYKYLLGLIKGGLYEQFYEDIKTNFVCFLDPAVYGRSTLENSSFIASSVNPNPSVHGQGFVARLSGSTAEFLSMWNIMMVGKKWFGVENDELTLTFDPILPAWLFDEANQVSFKFLGHTTVTYHNPGKLDTYDARAEIDHMTVDGETYISSYLKGSIVEKIRQNKVQKIEVYYKS